MSYTLSQTATYALTKMYLTKRGSKRCLKRSKIKTKHQLTSNPKQSMNISEYTSFLPLHSYSVVKRRHFLMDLQHLHRPGSRIGPLCFTTAGGVVIFIQFLIDIAIESRRCFIESKNYSDVCGQCCQFIIIIFVPFVFTNLVEKQPQKYLHTDVFT